MGAPRPKAPQPTKTAPMPTRWAPTFVVGVTPLAIPTRSRDELVRLAKCPESKRREFIAAMETCLASYRVTKLAIKHELPRIVRSQLLTLHRLVKKARLAATSLSNTAEGLFSTSKMGEPRYPSVRLKYIEVDIERALEEANRWPKGRLTDYAKLHLITDVAVALRDIAGRTPTASTRGSLQHCVQVLLRLADSNHRHLDDLTRSLRTALRQLPSPSISGHNPPRSGPP